MLTSKHLCIILSLENPKEGDIFNTLIKEVREAKGLSQAEFA